MRVTTAISLVASLVALPVMADAQGTTATPAANAWTGRSVALARVGGRSMAAACPELAQVDHFVRERSLKWDEASIGCRFMLSGNFSGAKVVKESGDYIQVKFSLTSFATEHTLWTPRRNFRLLP